MAATGERTAREIIADETAAILSGARDSSRRVVEQLEELRRNLRRLRAAGDAAKAEGDDDVQRG